jgi:hypothetical protein
MYDPRPLGESSQPISKAHVMLRPFQPQLTSPPGTSQDGLDTPQNRPLNTNTNVFASLQAEAYDVKDSEAIKSPSPPHTGQVSPLALSTLSLSPSPQAGAYDIQEVIRSPSPPCTGKRQLPCLSTNEPLGATHRLQPQSSSLKADSDQGVADSSSTSHETRVHITLLYWPTGRSIGPPVSAMVSPTKSLNVDTLLQTR